MVFDIIAKVIVDKTECDISEVKPESTFKELGIDSLDTVEMVMQIEDQIGKEIELEDKVETVGELVKYIEDNYMK